MAADGDRPQLPASHVSVLARGDGWRISDVRCHRGPEDRPFEEQHGGVSLGAVLSGTFCYRSAAGRALLYPGALLLGRAGSCFECGHEHGRGDHCLALQFDAGYFDQVSRGRAALWRVPMLPPLRALAAPLARVQARLRRGEGGIEEAALQFGEAVVDVLCDRDAAESAPTARDQRRIAAVLRHVEQHCGQPLDLDRLATLACMSKYHFLRTFRRAVGLTPHQYLLQQRVRRAASALIHTDAPVATLAYDAGFGDLSSFHALFRRVYGRSPAAFRAAA